MSPLLSRIAVIAAGLPLVLFAAYYGSWALFALAAAGALLALHELYQMARSLRPLVLAGFGGALAAVLGASLGGPEWMLGGFALTLLLAFVFAAVSETAANRKARKRVSMKPPSIHSGPPIDAPITAASAPP